MVDLDETPKPQNRFTPPNTERWSVEELQLYRSQLEAEIVRVDEQIARAGDVRSQADALFQKG